LHRASGQFRPWFALALLQLLSGCLGAVALPLLAGGTLMATDKHRVRAATQVAAPAPARTPATPARRAEDAALSSSTAVLTSLKELPPPSGASATPSDDSWQLFFAYAQARQPNADKDGATVSALLKQPPSIDTPVRLPCNKQASAVVIDLDDGPQAFVPERLGPAPAAVAEGLNRLREAGVVILWITRLPAGRAAEVAQALRVSGLDPRGQDQLLLLRKVDDRKQLLRQDASEDVCIVAVAGDQRGDFDELFDYLRNPGSAAGLYPLMGHGWFLVPSLTGAANPSTER
jgi:hypothetical protein